MKNESQIPSFETEDEEAKWWFDHREQTADWLEKVAAEGRTKNLAQIRAGGRTRGVTPTVSIRIDPADVARAKALARALTRG